MNLTYLSPFANLWQSTVFAGVAGLLTLVLRKNRARLRHWVWLAASWKFLVPLSVLIALGAHVQSRTAPEIARSDLSKAIAGVSQPFTPLTEFSRFAEAAPAAASLVPAVLWGIWACGFLGIAAAWWVRWRRFRSAISRGTPVQLELPLPVVCTSTPVEPGVFGIFRPVLLLPEGIFGRLTPAQLEAVIAHELCHIQHRDNLIAAIHMFVETVFWFHPLVWWIGKRMVEERERACDEEVLRLGSEPRVYAEGILNACKGYLESLPVCVSGISGANLNRRIEAIMENRRADRLDPLRKALLAGVALAVLAGPVAIGIGQAPAVRAAQGASAPQSFEVAMLRLEDPHTTVNYNRPDAPNQSNKFPANRLTMFHTYLKSLIADAYGVPYNRIMGGPAWLTSQHYDLSAKVEGNARLTKKQMEPMLQNLLKQRLHLAVHTERRSVPGYALVVAKGGSRLKPNTGTPFGGSISSSEFRFQCVSVEYIASLIERAVKQPVVDKTGLTGMYDLDLKFTPDDAPAGSPGFQFGSIFSAVQEELGLRLVGQKVPVDYLVIDHVEKIPTET